MYRPVGRRADLVGAIGVGRESRDVERLPPLTPTSTRLADAFLRAAIRSPANGISGVCAAGFSRLPRRKSLTRWLLPPPLASPAKPLATVAYAARSTRRSGTHQ